MACGDVQLIVDTGTFGPGSGGHSHADTLSLVLRIGEEQILVDPGTYTYVGDPMWRDRFRGTAAHNTVRIDGKDQATPAGPFAWQSRPDVELVRWETGSAQDLLVAACSYSGFRHQRTITFDKGAMKIQMVDEISDQNVGGGEHQVEQFWHFGVAVRQASKGCYEAGDKAVVTFEGTASPRMFEGGDYGWVSPAFGVKTAAPVVVVEGRSMLPISLVTLIALTGASR
jgi:hypothetical protein